MKYLSLLGMAMCCLLYNVSMAQSKLPIRQVLPNKATLFKRLPEKFTTSKLYVDKLFSGANTGAIKMPLTNNNYFEGVILEKVMKNPHVESMNIKSSNYDGAMLTISKITHDDKSVSYVGRIISIKYGDAYLLTFENDTFHFTKDIQSQLLVE